MTKELDMKFDKEVDLCSAFISAIPPEWTAYAETAGFDILLVRKVDGYQIGIEAKLRLNAKVISQAAEPIDRWYRGNGPDFRAVLVPDYAAGELSGICKLIGLTVIRQRHPSTRDYQFNIKHEQAYMPRLPKLSDQTPWINDDWYEFSPLNRVDVPDWVPDCEAGHSGPIMLTPWKVGAIKLAVILEKNGFLTRSDFAYLKISMSRWTQGSWIERDSTTKGRFTKSRNFPDFRIQHPVNYQQIEDDYEKWKQNALKPVVA